MLGSNSSAHSEAMTLTERSRSIFDATVTNLKFRVTGHWRTPLTEGLELIGSELASQAKLCIKHRSHMAWVEEETIAAFVSHVLWIVLQELAVKYIDEVSTTHGTAWVSTLGLLDHSSSKDANVIGSLVH